MDVFTARITRGDSSGFWAGVPVVYRAVVLNAGVGAIPGCLRHFPEQGLRVDGLHYLAGPPGGQVEGAALLDGVHELVRDPHGVIGVLVLNADDVLAAEVHVEAGVAQDPDLLLLAGLGHDEFLDVGVVDVEDDHLRRAPGGAARLDRPGRGVGAAHERDRAAGRAARGEQFLARPDPGQVDPRPGPALEDQALLAVPLQDRFHGVVDGQDEAVVHAQARRAAGEVLAALGLHVVDLHRAELLDLAHLGQPAVRAADVGRHVQELVTGAEEAGHGELADDQVGGAPDQVIRRDVEGLAVLRVQAQYLLDAVGLDRDDPGHAVGIMDLGAH